MDRTQGTKFMLLEFCCTEEAEQLMNAKVATRMYVILLYNNTPLTGLSSSNIRSNEHEKLVLMNSVFTITTAACIPLTLDSSDSLSTPALADYWSALSVTAH
jgi:hypothetical protein